VGRRATLSKTRVYASLHGSGGSPATTTSECRSEPAYNCCKPCFYREAHRRLAAPTLRGFRCSAQGRAADPRPMQRMHANLRNVAAWRALALRRLCAGHAGTARPSRGNQKLSVEGMRAAGANAQSTIGCARVSATTGRPAVAAAHNQRPELASLTVDHKRPAKL
jgi:hypothetical protein